MQIVSSVTGWASRPFRSDMNLGGWLAFVGLLIVAAIMWKLVLREILEA